MLTIQNHMVKHCGTPPDLKPETAAFISYFQNIYGEQWVCRYEVGHPHAQVWGGDIGWETVLELQSDGTVPDLVVQPSEACWLYACALVVNELQKLKSITT
jgi:hypothetical protein